MSKIQQDSLNREVIFGQIVAEDVPEEKRAFDCSVLQARVTVTGPFSGINVDGQLSLRDGDDGQVWPFHCTRIADGSRTIAADTSVTFRVEPGPTGFEAVDVAAGSQPARLT